MDDLAKTPYLLRRNGKCYFRIKVPSHLKKTLNKNEIKVSLRTSDLKLAKQRIPLHLLEAQQLFSNAEKELIKLSNQNHSNSSSDISNIELERIVVLWFQELEQQSEEYDYSARVSMSADERYEVLDSLREDLAGYESESENVIGPVHGIEEFFSDEIVNFQSDGFSLVEYEHSFCVKRLENYWDIPVENATLFVHRLQDTFFALANNSSISTYSDADQSIDGAAICLRGRFRNGEILKLYAKTNSLLRLEVEYRFQDNPSLAPDRRYSFQNTETLFEFISDMAQNSSDLSQAFWRELRRYDSLSTIGHGNSLHFITELYSLVEDTEIAKLLLTLLVTQGGISTSKLTPAMRDALKLLKASGLLEHHRRPINRYAVSPRFREALAALA